MTVNIASLSVRLTGTAAADITALEVDGVAVAIGVDRNWSITVPVTADLRVVAITATGPTRVVTRAVTVRRTAAPTAPG